MPDMAPISAQPDPVTLRQTEQGPVLGFTDRFEAHCWHALPYVAAPVGDLRWRAPHPVQPWAGTRDATAMHRPAPQFVTYPGPADYPEAEGTLIGSEDCLYLSLWSPPGDPQTAPARRLPVMVWIHGGGNFVGHGAEYCGARLAVSQDVIVVAVNYRLGLLGWFAHSALHDAGSSIDDRSGNFGTLDTIAALLWVRDNIAAFGGDPANVTIFGESGGGWNIRALIDSPRAEGLFHRAIVQSASGYQQMSLAHAENFLTDDPAGHPLGMGEILLSLWLAAGKAADADQARVQIRQTPSAEIAAFLRGQSFTALADAVAAARTRNQGVRSSEALTAWTNMTPPLLFTDGVVLADQPHNRVPVMIGTTRYEDRGFISSDPRLVTILGGVPRIRDPQLYDLLSEYLGKFYKAQAADEVAANLSERGFRLFGYRFDFDDLLDTGWLDFGALIGAGHGSDVKLVFGTPDLGREMALSRHCYDTTPGSSYDRFAQVMMSYWAAFAADGDPGCGRRGELPRWEEWNGGRFIILDRPEKGGLVMSDAWVDRAKVIAEIRSDARLAEPAMRNRFLDIVQSYFLNRLSDAEIAELRLGTGPSGAEWMFPVHA